MKQTNSRSKNKELSKEELETEIRNLKGELKLATEKIENLEHELKYAQHFKNVVEHDLEKCKRVITLALELLEMGDNSSITDAILSLSLAPIYQKGEGIH